MTSFQKKTVILALAPFVLAAQAAQAATITFSPTKVTAHVGESFTLSVNANASGTTAYTVKAAASFTPGLLRLSTWNYGGAWMALRQPGYDSFDNALGTLVRTAGYAQGFTGSVPFAKAVFVAQSIGTGTIKITSGSAIYDAASANVYTGGNAVDVTVLPAVPKPAAPAPAPPPTPIQTCSTPAPPPAPVPCPSPVSAPTVPSAPDQSLDGILLLIVGLMTGSILGVLTGRWMCRDLSPKKRKKKTA